MEWREQRWFAMVRSFIDAAQPKIGLKNAFGQSMAADSRKLDRGAQGRGGGSCVNR